MSGDFPNITPSDRRLVGLPIIGFPSASTPQLQFNATLNAFEWVSGSSLSELEFLQAKSAAGKLRNVSGSRAGGTGIGTVLTITPPAGVTTVLVTVTHSWDGGGSAAGSGRNETRVDGVAKSITSCVTTGTNNRDFRAYDTTIKGIQLIGDGIKTITIQAVALTAVTTIRVNVEAYDL